MTLFLLNCFPILSMIYNDSSAKDTLKPKDAWQENLVMEKTGISGTSIVLPNKEYGF